MLINLRNALMAGKRLPYDAEVEYIESTGTQYIDCIGLRVESADTIVCNFASLEHTADRKYYGLMCYGGVNGTGAVIGYNRGSTLASYQSKYRLGYLGASFKLTEKAIDSNFHLTEWGPSGFSVDGVLADSQKHANFEIPPGYSAQDFHFPIFSGAQAYENRLAFSNSKMRLAHFAISGKIDLIPVRKGTVGYLYDRVSGKLFGNAGTGDFVVGPDVVPVEYIESHGTQWIDTGIVPTADDSFYCRIQQSIVRDWCLWGLAGVAYCFSNATGGGSNAYGTYWGHPAIGMGGVSGVNPLGDTNWHEILCQPSGIFVDGTQINTQVTAPAQSPLNTIALFARSVNSAGGGVAKIGLGRMSVFRAERNGDPLRKYFSVRVGTEGAMMDVLTRRIYRNAGTGAFTYGNDLKYPIPAE